MYKLNRFLAAACLAIALAGAAAYGALASPGCSLPPAATAPKGHAVDGDEAKRIAVKNVPGSKISDIVKFDFDKAKGYYVVQIYYLAGNYEVTVNAADGAVVYISRPT